QDRREDRDNGGETEQRVAAGIHCDTCRLWAVGFRLWDSGSKLRASGFSTYGNPALPAPPALPPFIDKTPSTNQAHQGQSSPRALRRAPGRSRTGARTSILLVAMR